MESTRYIVYIGMSAHREMTEFVYCSSSHLRLTECVPLNFCLYKIGISKLVCVGRRHYKAPAVIVLMSFNDVNSHIICEKFHLHSSFDWSLGNKIFIRRYGVQSHRLF